MRTTHRRALAVGAATALAATATTLPASAADPVTSTASLSSTEVNASYSDTTVSPGDSVTADITFTNINGQPKDVFYAIGSGGQEFSDVFQLDACSAAGVDPSCTVVSDGNGDALLVEVDGLPPKSTTVTVDLTVRTDAPVGTTPFTQSFNEGGLIVTADFTPPVSFTVQQQSADLGVALDATAGPLLGSQITYDLAVTNDGPGDASAATVEIGLPTQTSTVTSLPGECTYSSGNDTVTCDTGAVASGSTTDLTFTARLGLLSLGTLNAEATITSSAPGDPNSANDQATAQCSTLTSLLISCS